MTSNITFDADLLRRYDRPGPRYTSYPTAPRFTPASATRSCASRPGAATRTDPARAVAVRAHARSASAPASTAAATASSRATSRARRRLPGALVREIELVAPLFDRDREVMQLHFGGGTPNFLSRDQLANWWRACAAFPLRARAPTATSRSSWTRASSRTGDIAELRGDGLQPRQPRRAGLRSGGAARGEPRAERRADAGGDRGLPRQRLPLGQRGPDLRPAEADAGRLRPHARHRDAARPDRLAIYGYAHLPQMFKAQRRSTQPSCPIPPRQAGAAAAGDREADRRRLRYIGMDHFALPDDDLAQAQEPAPCIAISWATPRMPTAT